MSIATASDYGKEKFERLEDVRIRTKDGRMLAGRLHHAGGAPRLAIVLHGGVGFPARYYQDFAAWFASQHQAAILTYDYRDFGSSLTGSLARSDARLCDWAIIDQAAALAFLSDRFPDLPVRVIGHSLGGQWLAFHEGISRVDRVAAVAAGPAFWLDHPWPMRLRVTAFWWLIGPAAASLAGYLPGQALGLGANLPSAVYWEWRRLCLRRGYHRNEWGQAYPQPDLEAARFKLALIPVTDDMTIAPHMVRKLPAFYPHAQISEVLLDPHQLGLKAIGHGGAFKANNKACWPVIAATLWD